MTGPDLEIKLGRIVQTATDYDPEREVTAPELHKINDEIAAMMIREIQQAPCEHPVEQRYKVGVFPKIGERCGVCGRDVESREVEHDGNSLREA